MRLKSEKKLATYLLTQKENGYSIFRVSNRSKFAFLMLVTFCGYIFWRYLQTQAVEFLFLSGVFTGAMLQNFLLLKRLKDQWDFNEKIIDWDRVENIARSNDGS